MANTVAVLTMGGYHFSLGDIATMRATQQALAELGVPSVSVDEAQIDMTHVIGGGAILGHQPRFSRFCIPGPHVLNAVGVQPTGVFTHLDEYRYLSVRDHESADLLGRKCEVVPCPVTLLRPSDTCRRDHARDRGGHIVVHRDPVVESLMRRWAYDYLVVDPQPWRKAPWGLGGEDMGPTHSPEAVISAMEGATVVVSRSLHLSILALCAGVPFACIDTGDDPQTQKMRNYWKRAGAAAVMYSGDDPVRHALTCGVDFLGLRDEETTACWRHFGRMVSLLA